MDKQFEVVKKTRKFILNYIKELNNNQLNNIPVGFNNNIIWHLGHIIAAQQGICYRRGGLPYIMTEAFFDIYKPGTKPEGIVNEKEIENIKLQLIKTIDIMEEDYKMGKFSNIQAWINRFDVSINNIDDTIEFLIMHDGLHIGNIMAMKKLV